MSLGARRVMSMPMRVRLWPRHRGNQGLAVRQQRQFTTTGGGNNSGGRSGDETPIGSSTTATTTTTIPTPGSRRQSDYEWQKSLSAEEFHILRQKGTERPGSGEYNKVRVVCACSCA